MTEEDQKKLDAKAERVKALQRRHDELMREGPKYTASILKDMLEDDDRDRKAVPENVFREVFMPFFTQQVQGGQDAQYLQHWVGLVGSAYNWANVVDVQGKVVFEVPPVLDTEHMNTERGGKRIGTFLSEYVNDMQVHPAMGMRTLSENWPEKLAHILPEDEQESRAGKAWKNIFRYYGVGDDVAKNEKLDPAKPARSSFDDEFDFP